MQTRIHERFAADPDVAVAESILRSCVHCGFCNATCPTYRDLGDERDGPRGRIYLVKQFLEDGEAGDTVQRHLDRCLTCRSCETTCPSGVEYGKLADIGRRLVDSCGHRSFWQRIQRRLLLSVLPYPSRFTPLLTIGRLFRWLLPARLRHSIPVRRAAGPMPAVRHSRRVILLGGCVQASATPRTNAAAARVLDRLGVSAIEADGAGCCGGVSYHLARHDAGRAFMRRNLDAWRMHVENGAEAVVSLSSGCAATLREYGFILRDDPDYADLAAEVSHRTRDLSEILLDEDLEALEVDTAITTALHCPCTLTHAIGAHESLRRVLQKAGVRLTATRDDNLCCGSAGTYSILQPEMSRRLLERKIEALLGGDPGRIVTANIGCQLHIGSRAPLPVQHWIELFDRERPAD